MRENISKLTLGNFGGHIKSELSFLYGPYLNNFQNRHYELENNVLRASENNNQLATSVFPSNAWQTISGWIKNIGYQIIRPWLLKDGEVEMRDAFTKIGKLFMGSLHIQGEVCVDDTCISKEQFKQMIINSGAQTSTSTATTTLDNATSTIGSVQIIDLSVPVNENLPASTLPAPAAPETTAPAEPSPI